MSARPETFLLLWKSDRQMKWATPVDHRLGYSEFLQERPRAFEENEDGLLQGLTVRPCPLASLVFRNRCGRTCKLPESFKFMFDDWSWLNDFRSVVIDAVDRRPWRSDVAAAALHTTVTATVCSGRVYEVTAIHWGPLVLQIIFLQVPWYLLSYEECRKLVILLLIYLSIMFCVLEF